LLLLAGGTACDGKGDPDQGAIGRLAAALKTSGPTHDVAGVSFVVVQAGQTCDDEPIAKTTASLEEEPLPKHALPAGAGKAHPFADGLFVLPPGAYKVCATPSKKDGKPSDRCARAETDASVMAEATTEVLLVSQCQGDPTGALDAIAALNTPPRITNLKIKDSKFITQCEKAAISVEAMDPNGDALSYAWEIVKAPVAGEGNVVGMGAKATFTPGGPGAYELKVTVTDVFGAKTSLTFPVHVSAEACLIAKTFTLDEDFGLGSSINLVQDPAHQLQLSDKTKTFEFVWIAASARGTIVKIDTRTGEVLGEYLSSPAGRARNPSRTTVDKNGSVWASNRDESTGGKGSIVHIGLLENGQCQDRNGNGIIETSTGLGDIRPWSNAGDVDSNGGVSTAADECIVHYTRVNGTLTRHLSLDVNNDVWVGGLGNSAFEKVSGATGLPVPGTQFNVGCGGYGGVTDKNGVIWSSRNLLRFDPTLGIPAGAKCVNLVPGAYGLAVSPSNGNVWVSALGGGDELHEIDPVANTILNKYPQGMGAQGVAVDANNHVWVAEIFGTRVMHFAPDPMVPGKHVRVGDVTGLAGVTGVAVAADGKIWASEINSSTTRGAARIDPNAGPIGAAGIRIGAVDLTVGLDKPGLTSAQPYNYSDMTGSTLIGAPTEGTWTVVWDTATASVEWGTITWNTEPQGGVPGDASLVVKARSSTDGATWSASEVVSQGVDLSVPDGRYIEVSVAFKRATTGQSPVLSDLAIAGKPLP
jgi:streptogramin lyase